MASARLVCSASDLYQGQGHGQFQGSRYRQRELRLPPVTQNAYDLTIPSPDSDFSSQDLDSSGYFSAVSCTGKELWEVDPHTIVRSACELRDLKAKRKILTNGSLKTFNSNNSVNSLSALTQMGPLEEGVKPGKKKTPREPQVPEPMHYPGIHDVKKGAKDKVKTHSVQNESVQTSHGARVFDYPPEHISSISLQVHSQLKLDKCTAYSEESTLESGYSSNGDLHRYDCRSRTVVSPEPRHEHISSSSRDVHDIGRMVGSARELAERNRHQRKQSHSRSDLLALAEPKHSKPMSNDDKSRVIGSAKDLLNSIANEQPDRQRYRRRTDNAEGSAILIRSNENIQRFLKEYITPAKYKEGHPTSWDYFIAEAQSAESSTDPEDLYIKNPSNSCPEFQQYGVEQVDGTKANETPQSVRLDSRPGERQVTLDTRVPPAKSTHESINVSASLQEPETPTPSHYMPLSVTVCLLCSVFAVSTIVLSGMLKTFYTIKLERQFKNVD